MIKLKRITNTGNEEYRSIEKLMIESFPTEEYRPICEQRENVEKNRIFELYAIYDNEQPIGFISFWKLNDFIYIEHFVIKPCCRNNGYGEKVISLMTNKFKKIVLEVETPDNETSKRRITFYQRCRLELCPYTYMQPPYRADGKKIPMFLMSYGVDMKKEFHNIKSIIYDKVYNQEST